MNKSMAINRYLNGSKQANETIEKIAKWNPAKSVEENAAKLFKKSYQGAFQFATRFGLDFKKLKPGKKVKKVTKKKVTKKKVATPKPVHDTASVAA